MALLLGEVASAGAGGKFGVVTTGSADRLFIQEGASGFIGAMLRLGSSGCGTTIVPSDVREHAVSDSATKPAAASLPIMVIPFIADSRPSDVACAEHHGDFAAAPHVSVCAARNLLALSSGLWENLRLCMAKALDVLSRWWKVPATAIRHRRKLDFIVSERLRNDDRFLQFLAFGFVFDDRRTRGALDRYVEAKLEAPDIFRSGWDKASEQERFAALDDAQDRAVGDCIASIDAGREPLLGLSGGFDSRLILHYLRRRGLDVETFTFLRKFDTHSARDISERLGVRNTLIAPADLSFEDFYERAKVEQDIVFLRRLAASATVARLFPDRPQLHGYLGGAVTGGNLRVPPGSEWTSALRNFAGHNDPFGLMRRVGGQRFLPGKPLVPAELIDFDAQLDLGWRQELRIRPAADRTSGTYRFPFSDRGWTGAWLNRSLEDRSGQQLYLAFIRWLDAPEFADMAGFAGKTGGDVREELAKRHAAKEKVQRRRSRTLFAEALPRLRARNVFSQDFLDAVAEGSRTRKQDFQLICCTEIALGAGWFD